MKYPRVKLNSIKANGRYAFVGGPFGSNLTTRDYVEEGVPVIRGSNQSSDSVFHDDDYVFVSEEKAVQLTPNLAFPGDVIFTQRGTLGQVGVIPKNAKYDRYVISQSQMKLAVHPEKADAMYVYYYFRRPDIVQTIINLSQSSGVPHINLGTLKNFEIPLPPVDIQRRIISTLSTYDDLIENNRRRIELLEQSARMLYREWFVSLRFPGHEHVKVTDGVPQEWKETTVFDVMEIMSGGTPKTQVPGYWDGNIPFYTPKDYSDAPYVLKTERSITDAGLANCNSHLYPKKTIFISARGTVGKIIMAQKPMAMSQTSYALSGKNGLSPFFLYSALQANLQQFLMRATGAVFSAIVVDTFKNIPFILPTQLLIENVSSQNLVVRQANRTNPA